MKPYGNQLNFKKKVPYEGKKDSEKISIINIKLVHQIFDTINISLLVLIFTLFYLSFLISVFFSFFTLLIFSASDNTLPSFDIILLTLINEYCCL